MQSRFRARAAVQAQAGGHLNRNLRPDSQQQGTSAGGFRWPSWGADAEGREGGCVGRPPAPTQLTLPVWPRKCASQGNGDGHERKGPACQAQPAVESRVRSSPPLMLAPSLIA